MSSTSGHPLADLAARHGAYDADEAAELLLPVARSLAAVHARGGAHGAVSPDAIVVDDVTGRAALLDRADVRAHPHFTPRDPGPLPTPAADVWSLAATLHQLVTGIPPYVGTPVDERAGRLGPVLERSLLRDPGVRPSMATLAATLGGASGRGSGARSDLLGRGIAVAVVALVVLVGGVAVAVAVAVSGEDPSTDRAPAASSGAPSSPPAATGPDAATPEPAEPSEPPSAEALEQYARDYVATASSRPRAGYAYLTPAYQAASPRYVKVWRSIRSPRFLSISADPEAMTVSYAYRYRVVGAGRRTEDVTLHLVETGGRLLIENATGRLR